MLEDSIARLSFQPSCKEYEKLSIEVRQKPQLTTHESDVMVDLSMGKKVFINKSYLNKVWSTEDFTLYFSGASVPEAHQRSTTIGKENW